jgi:hypothetical protein
MRMERRKGGTGGKERKMQYTSSISGVQVTTTFAVPGIKAGINTSFITPLICSTVTFLTAFRILALYSSSTPLITPFTK